MQESCETERDSQNMFVTTGMPQVGNLSENKQGKQCTYKSKMEARSRNHCCRRKALSITYFHCVSAASVIQHVLRMRHIVLSPVACLPLPYFATLSHKRHDFRKKLLNIKCVFWFSIQLCLKHFLFQDEVSEILSQMYTGLHVKCSTFLSDFNETWFFSTDF
jgi:hypothetical protein